MVVSYDDLMVASRKCILEFVEKDCSGSPQIEESLRLTALRLVVNYYSSKVSR